MALKDFHHPFQPYDIQQRFMEEVYRCIEDAKVGIFESPTGTGKSLSLICGSLTWLREHKRQQFAEAIAAIQLDDDDPEWMVEHAREQRRREASQLRADFEARLDAVRKKEDQLRERKANGPPPTKRRRLGEAKGSEKASEEDQFLLDEYESDDESANKAGSTSGYSAETTKLMEKLGMLRPGKEDKVEETEEELKIYFCSRTHSQLSQFVGELQRVRLPAGLPPENDDVAIEQVRQISLGARKNLCVNPEVLKLSHPTAINERCLELQQPNTPADHKCLFLPKKEDQDHVLDFRDHALARIRDIEDLAAIGTKLQVCPYYASRSAIGPAEMVTLPYPLLLQKSAREALGISTRGHVVIIDEAHNLMDAIEGICSAHVTQAQLKRARESLMIYLQKFRSRLKGANRVYVTQVVRVVDSLLLAMSTPDVNTVNGGVVAASALLSGKGVDQINLAKLVRYLNESKLARKVEGYVQYAKEDSSNAKCNSAKPAANVPTLTHIQNFLGTLMNPSKEGRFFLVREQGTIVLKYLLLDPSQHFREIVQEARAVILAGGTMSPMDDYRQQLFPYLSDIQTLSCGHLIPSSSLLVRTVGTDSEGPLEFSYKTRNNAQTASRIGRALLRMTPHVTAGLVVFFPSYGFLEQVTAAWKRDEIYNNLNALKPLFADSRAASAEDTFRAYSDAIKANPRRGATLLSVIGGKLSEGINFSDDLGRCVVVVGLPFPNLETPEWKAKLQYLDEKAVARGEARGTAGRNHAENVCMRSVNQAIGRVIRHKGDWASIVLMDGRYGQERIWRKLPGWIREGMVKKSECGVEDVVRNLKNFFEGRST